MLTLVELFLDALSIGGEIEQGRRDDRQRRRDWSKTLTYTGAIALFVVIFVAIQLI